MEKRKDCINPCIGPDCEGCRNYKPKEEVISMETRKEKIIEILKSPRYFLNGKVYLSDFYRIADAILALPIEVPSDKEIKQWIKKDRQSLIDCEVATSGELMERFHGREEGVAWLKSRLTDK